METLYILALTKINVEEKVSDEQVLKSLSTEMALKTDEIINDLIVVDWHTNKMVFLIGDYLIDEVRDKYQLDLSFGEIDELAKKMVDVAKIRYK